MTHSTRPDKSGLAQGAPPSPRLRRGSTPGKMLCMLKVLILYVLEKLAKLPTCLLMTLTQLLIAVTDAFIALHTFLLTRLAHAALKWREQRNKPGKT